MFFRSTDRNVVARQSPPILHISMKFADLSATDRLPLSHNCNGDEPPNNIFILFIIGQRAHIKGSALLPIRWYPPRSFYHTFSSAITNSSLV
jgi:hypothetical protein